MSLVSINTMNAAAFEFHRKPYGLGNCPVCGVAQMRNLGEHRAVREDEDIDAKWIRIEWRGTEKKIVYLGRTHPRLRHARIPIVKAAPPSQYDFHRKPRGKGPCPYCGLSLKKNIGEHRAVREDEGIPARWIRVEKRGFKQKLVHVGFAVGYGFEQPSEGTAVSSDDIAPPRCRGPQVRQGGARGPSRDTTKKIKKIAELYAEGMRFGEIGKTLKMSVELIGYFRRTYPEIWKTELDKNMELLVPQVQKALTANILNDPKNKIVDRVRVWGALKNREIFVKDKELMLSNLLKQYVRERPNILPDSVKSIEYTINNFRRFLAHEPMLTDLSKNTMLDWMAWNAKERAPRSVNHHRGNLLALWNFAANADLIENPPRILKRKEPRRHPVAWTLEEIGLLYATTDRLNGCYGDVPKSLVWKIALSIAWDTAVRVRALKEALVSDVNLVTGFWTCRAETIKGGQNDEIKQLHPETLALIRQSLNRPRKLLWPFPGTKGTAIRHLGKLLDLAGLPNDRKHKFHCIRRTAESYAAAERGIEWAAAAVGHSVDVARKSYISSMICRPPALIDALPRPFATLQGIPSFQSPQLVLSPPPTLEIEAIRETP